MTAEVVKSCIFKLDKQSILRAYMIRVAFNEHLDLDNTHISKYIQEHKQPYLVEGKIVPIETCCKNYHIVMNSYYIAILREAVRGRILKIEEALLWHEILNYNKYEIVSREEYM